MSTPEVLVEPARPAWDTPLRIRVSGLPPGQQVTLRARTEDQWGRTFASWASFVADRHGGVDLSHDQPTAGSYPDVDPMGPIWSMVLEDSAGSHDRSTLPPLRLTLRAEVDGHPVAEATCLRRQLPDGVRRADVRSHGLVGTLFRPAAPDARPAVIVLGGAEGGMHELDAALLAGHGFVSLALAYFGAPGLPDGLVKIPLEYFGAALDFLAGLRQVDADRVGIIGGSRGAEAALLVAATYSRVGPVVCKVGSGLITQGIPRHPSLPEILDDVQPSWTLQGRALPFLPHVVTPEFRARVRAGEPVSLGDTFRPDLADSATLAAAAIEVERATGPLLFLTAGDDQGWPCLQLSRFAMARLEESAYQHVHYPDAGHPIAPPPYGPATTLVVPGPGVRFRMGGSAQANAHARADSWRQGVRFFTTHLRDA